MLSSCLSQRKTRLSRYLRTSLIAATFFIIGDGVAEAQTIPKGFTEAVRNVDGINLHYVEGGQGSPVLLIPGWLQTWFAWRQVMPALRQAGHRVIVVDIPGMGSSDRPKTGYDTGSIGTILNHLMQGLGYAHYAVMGHDVGMWVGYAMAADHPQNVSKLVLVEAIIPGLLKHEPIVFMPQAQSAFFWQFMFNQQADLPEMLLKDRERPFMAYLFQHWAVHPERIALDYYATVYNTTEGIHAQMAYYRAFSQTIAQNKERARQKLTMPVLALGGDHGVADFPREMMAPVTTRLSSGILKDCGHFAPDECPEEINRLAIPFLE
ncbi:alpha/beta fold hydrolase [Asaia sp. As-1742]|uniref:alpha/beta fold hydrolase n=1 Tax=Acetobacteraceae TaxID=433 RepID=UPI0014207843|nr:alpha/beta hydrolase [Asaia sp. As-1742]NIE79189.1 alpha/beta hydrolase [Asaia sp. As-1742]